MNVFEQFKDYGTDSLTNLQMLSALIGESSSRNILDAYDNLAKVARQSWQEIKHETLVSEEAAHKTDILFSLSRRINEAQVGYSIRVTSPEDAAAYLMPKLNNLINEHFYVVYLNNAKMVMGYDKISEGGSTATVVDPAAVMKAAILKDASSILLGHNHPSGNKSESKADVNLTERLHDVGKKLGIPVDDHLIIADGEYTSLKAKGVC